MKLHLPSGLRAALFACFAAFAGIGTTLTTATITGGVFAVSIATVAQAATTEDSTTVTATGTVANGTTYSGHIYTIDVANSTNASVSETEYTLDFANANAKLVEYNADGTEKDAISGTATSDENLSTIAAWRGFSDASNGTQGNTMRFSADKVPAGATVVKVTGNYANWCLGGLIVEESDITWSVGRHTGAASKTYIRANGDANFTIGSDTSIVATTDVQVQSGGTWAVAGGKTFSINPNGDSTVTVADDLTINITKLTTGVTASAERGNVVISDALTLGQGSSINVGANTSLTLGAGATLNGVLSVAGSAEATLNGTFTLSSAIVNNGAITFGEGAVLDISALTDNNGSYTLFTAGEGGTLGTVTGLTIDNITGVETAGKTWTLNNDGTLTYVQTAATLTCGSGTLAWTNGVQMDNGSFNDGDLVTFTGTTEVTMGAALSSAKVTVADGAALSLSNGGVSENTLNAASLVLEGTATLTLKDAVLSGETRVVSAESAGTIVIDADEGTDLDFTSQLADFSGALQVEGGRYKLYSQDTNFSSVTVVDGGQLSIEGDYSGNVTISGNGINSSENRDTAMRMGTCTLSGGLTVASDAAIAVWGVGGEWDNVGTIAGAVNGTGSLSKTEGGKLYLRGDVSLAGNVYINSGELGIGSINSIETDKSSTNAFNVGDLYVSSGAVLSFCRGELTASASDVYLSGGTLRHIDTASASAISQFGSLVLEDGADGAASQFDFLYKGHYVFADLTGEGSLEIGQYSTGNHVGASEQHILAFESITNYSGTISKSDSGMALNLTLASVHQDAGVTATVDQSLETVYFDGFAKTGAGDLVIGANVAVSGILTMNYEGGLYSDAEKTAGLNISSVADGAVLTYTSASNLLNLSAAAVGESSLTINLLGVADQLASGIDLGVASTVDVSQLALAGIAGGEFSQQNGTWWYTGGGIDTPWDVNWGATIIGLAPVTLPSTSELPTRLSGENDTGEFSMADNTTYCPEGSGTASILITGTQESGSLFVFGGQSSEISNSGRSVELDTWIKMTGGDVKVIAGGNYCNNWGGGGALNFVGDSHIYITNGETTTPVVDYIIGGNFKDGKSPVFTGDSYISIASDSVQGGIIGGSTVAHSATTTFTGNSHIYIYTPQTLVADTDLFGISAENGNVIVGGNAKMTNISGTLNFNGNTNITLDFAGYTEESTMAKAIIGGSYTHNFTGHNLSGCTHTGNTNITISNAATTTFSKDIIGGSKMHGTTSTISGTASIGISSGTYTGMIIGGHYATAGSSNFSLGGATLNLSGGSYQGNIYAAGYLASGESTVTTGSTTLTIAEGVTLGADGAAITVSGGYGGEGTGGTVAGNRTLNLSGSHANATFTDFDVVNIASGNSTATFAVAEGATLSKAGAGTLTLGASSSGAVSVQAGSLVLNGQSLTATTVANGATLDGSAAGSAAGALTLGTTAGDIVNLQVGSGLAVSTLSLADGAMINVLDNLPSGDALTLFTGLSFDASDDYGIAFTTEDDVKVADLATYVSNADAFADCKLILTAEGTLIIANEVAYGAWNWNAPGGATWDNSWADGDTEWLAGNGDSPEGRTVIFGNDGVDAANGTTVTISGSVAPKEVLVNATNGHYIFVGADDASGITGTAELVKDGAGKLTISLANSYSGGTTINAGELEVTAAGALGTGDVTLAGGTLTQAADLSNKVIFAGGSLSYQESLTVSSGNLDRAEGATINVAVASGKTATWQIANGTDTTALFGNGMVLSGGGTLKVTSGSVSNIGSAEGTISISGADTTLEFESTLGTGTNYDVFTSFTGNGHVIYSGNGGAISLNGDASGFAGTLELKSADAASNTPFYFVNANAAGGADTTLALNGAVFRGNGENTIGAGKVTVAGTNVLVNNEGATTTMTGAVSGSGTLKVRSGAPLHLTGSVSDFSGSISDDNGAVSVTFGNGAAYAGADVFAAGATLAAGQAGTSYAFNYSNASLNMNAEVGGTADLVQNGSGELVLTGANTSTGTLTVNAGTLTVAGGWAGTSATVAEGATLHLAAANGTAVSAVTSSGTVILEGGNDLASLSGGNLTAKGDVTLDAATGALGTVTVDTGKTLTVNGDVTLDTLAGSGALKLDDGTSRYDLTFTSGAASQGTVIANKVSVGADSTFGSLSVVELELAHSLSVTNALSDLTSLKVTADSLIGLCSETTPLVSAGSLTLGTALGVSIDAASLSGSEEAGYVLIGSAAALDASVANILSLDVTGEGVTYKEGKGFLVDQIAYSLGVDGNNIVLTGAFGGETWNDEGGTTLSSSGGTDGLGEVTTVTSETMVRFAGSDTVTVDGDVTLAAVRIDTTSEDGYVFTGAGESDSIAADSVAVVAGDLTLDGIAVTTDKLTVGQSKGTDAGLVLAEGSEVVAGTATVFDTADGSGLVIQSGASMYVANDLSTADDVSLTVEQDATLGMGSGSSVAQISGSDGNVGIIEVSGNNVSIGSVDGTVQALLLGNDAADAQATVGADLTLYTLEATAGSELLLSTPAASADEAATFHKLTMLSTVESGGNVTVGDLDLTQASGSSFTMVTTTSLVLDLNGFASMKRALAVDELLTADLNVTGALTLTLGNFETAATQLTATKSGLTDATSGLAYTDYVLVNDTTLTQDEFDLITVVDADKIQQAFALAGTYAHVELVGGNLVLRVHEDDPRYWNGGSNFTDDDNKWAGNPGNNGGLVLDISTLDTYKALDTVDVVNISKATVIDLTAVDPSTATTPEDGLVIRNLTGTETLSITGNSAAEDVVTLRNTTAEGSAMSGDVTLTDVTVKVDALADAGVAEVGALSLGAVELAGDATLLVTDSATLDTGIVTLSGDGAALENEGTLTTGDVELSGLGSSVSNSGTLTTGDVELGDATLVINDGTLTTGDVTLAGADAVLLNTGTISAGDLLLEGDTASVVNGGTFSAGEVTLAGENALFSAMTPATVEAINGSAGTISGSIRVTGTTGSYSGSYGADTALALAANAAQDLTLGGDSNSANLALSAASGASATLSYAGNARIKSLNSSGASVTLDNAGTGTLTATGASAMVGGSLNYSVDAATIASGNTVVVTSGINLVGTTVNVDGGGIPAGQTFDLSNGSEGWELIAHIGAASLTASDVVLTGAFFDRYFQNMTVENGVVKADLVTDYYAKTLGETENGKEGMKMIDLVALSANPTSGDLADVISTLETYLTTADSAAADKLAASVAGAGSASLGLALAGDMERQLKAIRNRTTTMGVDPTVVNTDMPYFNAWINAEGDHRTLDQDGSLAGYTLNSWGGTVGFDMDVNPSLTWGLALTAMYGDFTAEASDVVEGDVDSYYISAFARATSGAWVHTFVASVGISNSELSRTVTHGSGSYTAEGEADGTSFGFMYEVGRTFALNEDASTCWQPVFNVTYRHTTVDAYTESGSDAALSVGEQTMDTVTFGLGARVQAIVGENIYNRTSVFEARALAKLEAGDRESELDTAFVASPAARGTVKSAEMDAFGVELGAGLTVPVGFDSGSIFLDGSVEFRGSYTNVNGTVGYRVNF